MAARRNTRNKEQGRSLPWGPMLLSFAVGAFVMFLLHLKDNVPEDKTGTTVKKAAEQEQAQSVEPTFDFYTLLPEMETVVENKNKGEQPVVTAPPEPPAAEPEPQTQTEAEPAERYMIQVGSFKKLADADGFRAKLALLGIESKVQTVTIDNKDTWHRVQIGPIAGRDQADALQRQLRENQIDSLLLRTQQSG
ncbi:SPOR domain-containing protein [Methylophaga sp. OBS1]|uniref:SPOR domain-containing protein n=1 Tax=Methylophaga sp. OBS1 TaxID=2991933 RepID=UPI00224E65AB|nr:SPOR domain-containing protein [Methylophaga sp. OBS1]MCX4192438.1 SPOR domain-containing protein [Methylophaga sp. OBS1]